MHVLSYYIPVDDHERVKQHLFDKGAGKMGYYDQCCWEVLGQGQFCPRTGSNPALGSLNNVKRLEEYKVEMVCSDDKIRDVVSTLLAVHPYEQPAYFVQRVMTLTELV